MSDSLRDRIAKLLYTQNADYDFADDVMIGWDELTDSYRHCWYRDADAVIAELGLSVTSGVIVGCLHGSDDA